MSYNRCNFSILIITLFVCNTSNCLFAQSPYTISWSKDGYLMSGSIATAFIASAVDDDFVAYAINKNKYTLHSDEVSGLSRESVNWFDRSATYNFSKEISNTSDALVTIAVLSPLGFLIDNKLRNDWAIISIMYVETTLLSTFVPSFGKGSILRYRPFVYNPEVAFQTKAANDPKRSFFSGHTTWAFASALFVSTVYDEYYPQSELSPYIWGGSLILASTIGILRYQSGAHYPTDILTGAAVGSTIGYLIPYLHKNSQSKISVIPAAAHDNFVFMVKYSF